MHVLAIKSNFFWLPERQQQQQQQQQQQKPKQLNAYLQQEQRRQQQLQQRQRQQCYCNNSIKSSKMLLTENNKVEMLLAEHITAIKTTTTTTTPPPCTTIWRRKRHRRARQNCSDKRENKNNDNFVSRTKITKKAINDNDNWNWNWNCSNYLNKINKLLPIAYMLLIVATATTTTINCQASAVPGIGGTSSSTNSKSAAAAAAMSPLSALLQSGGASYMAAASAPTLFPQQQKLTQQQQQQQQMYAFLAKNSLGGSGSKSSSVGAAALAAVGSSINSASGRHFLMLHADNDDNLHSINNNDDEDEGDEDAGIFVTGRDRARSADAARIVPIAASLETTGFVSDDGLQYEKAEKALAAAAAAAGGGTPQANNNHCPKECKCLNVFFDCGKLHLQRVPVLPNYVQHLDLVGNHLNDTIVLEIKNLPELLKLTLKRNQLEEVPKFTGLLALKHLNLVSNRIRRISSDALAALPKLKYLDLTKNQLHAIEANSFPKANRLAHLLLSSNEISSIDEHAFESLGDLVDLELNNNRLQSLPGGTFMNLGKLRKLSLNNNQLEIHWSTFRGLLSLQKLHLKSNNIRELQDGVFHVMRDIETIELDHNRITSLSRQGLFNLTKLQHLTLSNNSISRIELDTWEFTQSLETLDLSQNNITEFKPQHLDCLQRLKFLTLSHNKIQYLMDSTFDCVKNLEDLNLRRNRLSWVIEDPNAAPPFKALRKLKKLDLYGNNLKQINSKSLNGLSSLELLNLGGNALATVQEGAFEHMSRLQKLIFKSLNFICDCKLNWFRRFLQTKFGGSISLLQKNAVCGYPEHLLDRELLLLSNKELVCIDSPKPVLTQEPTNMLAVKGANITMECIANSPAAASLAAADELKIKWRHDNQNVRERPIAGAHGLFSTTETQIHHDQSTNQTTIIGYLRLYNVTYESAGRYQCVVSNAFGTTYSQKFKISIGIHPTFLQIPSNLTIDSGDTARLVCSATGDPMPEIALQKFGASDFPAATERRLQVIREQNAFLITNAKPSDSGIYTCTAESAAGDVKINATLLVNDKPQPAIPLARKEVEMGGTSVLECLHEDATSELVQPRREWYKENKPLHISPTSHSERYYFSTEKELLVIVNTQSMDAGNYRCEITDNFKTLTLQSELIVVKADFNKELIIVGVVMVTVACVLIGSCIIWSILYYQKHKLDMNNFASASHPRNLDHQVMLSGSRGSALDQTQLTTLNRSYIRQAQQQQQQKSASQQQQQQQEQQQQMRPRSLADLDLNHADHPEQRSRLIVTTTTNFSGGRFAEDGLTLAYLQHNDLEQQQDHLSSKDSGTGSDAAVKRSIEDFPILATASTPTPTNACPLQRRIIAEADDNDGSATVVAENENNEEDDDDNDLQYAPTRALGVSEYDMEMSALHPYDDEDAASHRIDEEQQKFLHNNSQYSRAGMGITSSGSALKCGTQISTNNFKLNPKPNPNSNSTTVDI